MLTSREIDRLQQRSAIARRSLAGAETPFILNAWYVAARSEHVSRDLSARQLLGRSVLLYRSLSGEVVALQNRCGHRSFPLSEGRLEGDEVVCRYHGLRYNSQGLCTALPDRSAPRGRMGIQRFPIVERASFVWIWLGDPDIAARTPVPHPDWLGAAGWDTQIGYARAEGSYIHLHENLLDLSHLTYLHEKSFGTPEYAQAPIEEDPDPELIAVWRNVECVLPDLYAVPLGWQGQRALRRSGSQLVSPGLHVNTGAFENLERGGEGGDAPMVKVAQLITPETHVTTHYHYAVCRNFAVGDADVSKKMLAGFTTAFHEDLEALRAVTDMQREADANGALFEFDLPTDRPGLKMRRLFRAMADAEIDAQPVVQDRSVGI